MKFENTRHFAQSLDEQDPLQLYRNQFVVPGHNEREAIYFLGNSLGLRPKKTAAYIHDVLQQWDREGVESFFKGDKPWLDFHDRLAGPAARIVGALPEEIVVMNTLTVNLHLMLVSFYKPAGKRSKILCEAKAFCSDQYMLETHVRQRGFTPEETLIELVPRPGEDVLRDEDILEAIERHREELCLVFFGGVNYYTGQVLDIKAIAGAAREAGINIGFDLAHAAGNVLLGLHDWGVDFACWCTYKYLNSGPGGIGAAFIHRKHHTHFSLDRFGGWWGHNKAKRFLMEKGFDPIPTAEGWGLSTPSPVLYAAHLASLEIFDAAGMENIYRKGQLLGSYLLFLLRELNASFKTRPLHLLTPENAKGCQVSILFPKYGKKAFTAISEAGVYADWREPDVIRVAPAPLYNRFEEVWKFSQILGNAMVNFS
jgi:kynureninase